MAETVVYVQQLGGSWYQGTADAIRQNVGFVRKGMTKSS